MAGTCRARITQSDFRRSPDEPAAFPPPSQWRSAAFFFEENTVTNTVRKLEHMLNEAAARGTWGGIEIEIKAGKPTLIRQTIQTRADEDTPDDTYRSRK
jgi:hypothetical protein